MEIKSEVIKQAVYPGKRITIDGGVVHEVEKKSDYEKIGSELGKLCAEKNKAYGSSFGEKSAEFLRLLYPEGVKPEQYGDMLVLARIFDKQMRIATSKDAFGESPYRDIAGYAILMSGEG